LTIGILVWLLVHIYRLIRSISKNEPFAVENPRRVKRIAYGVLFLALVGLLSTVLDYLLVPAAQLKLLLYNLMGVPMWAAFLGLAFLVIARVFEEGLRLNETEKFTI
jgi:cytochrome b561